MRFPGVPLGDIELLDSSSRDSVHELIKSHGGCADSSRRTGLDLFCDWECHGAGIEAGTGNCHIFVDESADMADRIGIYAKTQRRSVSNAAEHRTEYVPRVVKKLPGSDVEVAATMKPAVWRWECRCARRKLKIGRKSICGLYGYSGVASVDEAMEHINRYSPKNSEAIVTGDEALRTNVLRQADSAVYWNASTWFSDGGEFGFGTEMGIQHRVTGSGQVR